MIFDYAASRELAGALALAMTILPISDDLTRPAVLRRHKSKPNITFSSRPGPLPLSLTEPTMESLCSPRWLDPAVDPNERTPGACYLGDPQVVNT